MKRSLKAAVAITVAGLVILPALADDASTDGTDAKDLKKTIEDQSVNFVETAQKGITLRGYVDVSYTNQFAGRGQAFNTSDANGNNQHTLREFDTDANGFNVQAVKIALEKALPDKNDWAAGFRVDAILGSDATLLGDSAFGGTTSTSGTSTTSYPIALEQALVKFRVPVGNGLDIYAGKFVTFLGYEVIESPANLNFSRGLLFTDAIPLTNTGVYADYKFNDTFEAKLAIVDGWNSSVSPPSTFGNGTDAQNDYPFGGKAFMGQLNINAPGKNANITQSFIYSPSGEPGNSGFYGGTGLPPGIENGPIAVYDIWGNWNPTFVKDSALLLGFNVDFGYNGASGFPSQFIIPGPGAVTNNFGAINDSNTWYGVALYASYKLTKVITLSARGEYLHEDAAFAPKFGVSTVANDDFSETLTASFSIWDNLLTRVEYRFDSVVNGSTGAAGNTRNNVATYQTQNEISLEAVYSF